MDTRDPVYAEVMRFIRDHALRKLRAAGSSVPSDGDLKPDTPLLTTGLYDSLGFVELLSELEARYHIEVDFGDQDPAYFTTLGGLARIVADGVKQEAAGHQASEGPPASEYPPPASEYHYAFLRPGHERWADVAILFAEMYRGFEEQGLAMPLVKGGAGIWLEHLGRGSQGMQCVIGCTKDDELVGFLHGVLRVVPPYLAGRFAGSIEAVFVQPAHRRRGIAAELVRLAEDWFAEKGARHIELKVLVGNEAGRAFWERVGFRADLLQMIKETGK